MTTKMAQTEQMTVEMPVVSQAELDRYLQQRAQSPVGMAYEMPAVRNYSRANDVKATQRDLPAVKF